MRYFGSLDQFLGQLRDYLDSDFRDHRGYTRLQLLSRPSWILRTSSAVNLHSARARFEKENKGPKLHDNATGIPILVSGDTSTQLTRSSGRDERWLQELIHRHPACLPMDQIEPGLGRLIPACLELPLRVGYVDNLLLTPEGNLVIVEVKLWRNPEARRKVVAQALDYATALFELDYGQLEAAVMQAEFDGLEKPDSLYDLVDGADALPEKSFVDRVNRNLREGRVVVLIVGDGIRTDTESLVAGLQAHANFHFTFALIEMPAYARKLPDTSEQLVVVPHTLLKTITIPRFTISSADDSVVIADAGMEEADSKRPSRRSNISSEEFFEAMRTRAPDLPDRINRFLDDIVAIEVRAEFRASLNLKWDQPEGNPVNLGYIRRGGEVWTDASYWQVDHDLAEDYNLSLAKLLGGEVRTGRKKKDGGGDRWVTRPDGSAFFIEELADRFADWRELMEEFQDSIRARSQDRLT